MYSLIIKHLARSSDIGHLALRMVQEIYKKKELVGRTFDGTSRGLLISPSRRGAVVNLIGDQVAGSTRKDKYVKTAKK